MWKAEDRLHQEVQESEARADQVRIAELWIESREQHGAAVFQGELSTAASEARALRAELAAHVAKESRVARSVVGRENDLVIELQASRLQARRLQAENDDLSLELERGHAEVVMETENGAEIETRHYKIFSDEGDATDAAQGGHGGPHERPLSRGQPSHQWDADWSGSAALAAVREPPTVSGDRGGADPREGAGASSAEHDPLTALTRVVTELAAMQAAQLAAQQNAPDAKDKLAEAVISASRESSQRIKCPLPSLKVATADGLRSELKAPRRYFNEARIDDRRQWFRLTRHISTGPALTEFEYFVARDLGGEDAYQKLPLENENQDWWRRRWETFTSRLKQTALLDDECELGSARRTYSNVKLKSHSITDTVMFLDGRLGRAARAGAPGRSGFQGYALRNGGLQGQD